MRLPKFSLSCLLVLSSFSAACSVRTDRPRQFDGNDVNCNQASCEPDPDDDDNASGGRSGGSDTSRGGAADPHSSAGAPGAGGAVSAPVGSGGSFPTTPIFGSGGAQPQGVPTSGGAPGLGGSNGSNAPAASGGAPSGSGGATDAKGGTSAAMGGAGTNAAGGAVSPAQSPPPIIKDMSWSTSAEVVLVDGGNWHCARTDSLFSTWFAQTCIYLADGKYKPAVIVRNGSNSPAKMGAMVQESKSGNKFTCKATSVPANTYVACVGESLPVPNGATELLAQGFLVQESGTKTHVAYDYTMTFKP